MGFPTQVENNAGKLPGYFSEEWGFSGRHTGVASEFEVIKNYGTNVGNRFWIYLSN